MIKKVVAALLLASSLSSFAQNETQNKVNAKIYGFVRNDFYIETRKGINGADGLFGIIPQDENIVNGEDLNDQPSGRLLSIATRVGVDLKGPDVLGAKSSGRIEGDFCGYGGSATMFRIRHAFVKLDWDKYSVLMGNYWHPLMGTVIPDVAGLSTGSPFMPYNFSPQLRITRKINEKNIIYLAATYQLQFNSVGPKEGADRELATSAQFQTNGILPEINVGWEGKTENLSFNASANMLSLKPRTYSKEYNVKVTERVNSFSATLASRYKKDKVEIKGKTILGQNMSNLLLFGGYGVTKENPDHSYEYTNFTNSVSYINFLYGNKHKIGLFAGFEKNLGTSESLMDQDLIYVRANVKNLDCVYRGSVQYFYTLKHWLMCLEYEMTSAGYGTLNLQDGKVNDVHKINNHRITGAIQYFF